MTGVPRDDRPDTGVDTRRIGLQRARDIVILPRELKGWIYHTALAGFLAWALLGMHLFGGYDRFDHVWTAAAVNGGTTLALTVVVVGAVRLILPRRILVRDPAG